jgi:chromosome partitioning protein
MPDRKTRRISIVNHKGGVGKTTTAINLAAGLGARGYRVLLVDWDPQGNATQFVGLAQLVETDGVYGSANFAWGEAPFAPQRQVLPGVDLLPGTEELAFLEERMLTNAVTGAAFRLAQALEQVASDYQYIIADCGPTIGMMAMSAMIACPAVLMPIELAYGSIPGAFRLHKNIARLRESVDASIHIMGVLGTKHSDAARSPRQLLGKVRELFGEVVFETIIHTGQAVKDSVGKGRPIILLDPSDRGAIQYDRLTDEVIERAH